MALTKVSIPLIKSLGQGDPGQVLTAQSSGEFNWVYQGDLSAGSADYATSAGSSDYATNAGAADVATYAAIANSVFGGNVSGEVAFAATANTVAGANVTGTVPLAYAAATVTDNIQSNITQVGNLVSLSVAGDATVYGNLDVRGNVTYVESNVVAINDINITVANNAANAQQADGGGLTVAGANAQLYYEASSDSWNVNKYFRSDAGGAFGGTLQAESVVINGDVDSAGSAGFGGNISAGNIEATTNVTAGNAIVANTIVGSLVTAAQPNITSTGTLTSLTVAGNISANNASANTITVADHAHFGANVEITGTATIYQDLQVNGNINFTGNVTQISGNAGQFFGNTEGFEALYTGISVGFADLVNTVVQSSADANDYAQNNLQNVNGGNTASGDITVTSDVGDDTTNYIDMGIVSSAWDGTATNSVGDAAAGNDGYLYVQGGTGGGNLIIGTTVANTDVKFMVAGNGQANVRATLSSTGLDVVANVTADKFVGNGSALHHVTGANVTGTVANATYATSAGSATTANSVAVANVTGIGNIATINLNGNGSQALLGNGAWGNVGSSGTTISAWALANSYSNGALVIYNSTIWQAQSNIAANTAFVSGNIANTWTALTSGVSLKVETFTATAGQTTFTANIAPSGSVEFNINGILISANAVSVSGTTITYTAAQNGSYVLLAGDKVTITYTYGTSALTSSLGTTTISNLTVSGSTTLGAVGNVHISGGSNGQVLVTNGSGTLTWGNAAPTVSMKVQEIVATAGQTSFTISATPLGNVSVAINGSTIRPSAISVSNTTVTYTAANNYSYTIEENDSVIFTYISSS